jgi:hypothetical protein
MDLVEEGEEAIGSRRTEENVVEKKGCYQFGLGIRQTAGVSVAIVAVVVLSAEATAPRARGLDEGAYIFLFCLSWRYLSVGAI